MAIHTLEQKRKYAETRRKKYATNADYRSKVLSQNRATREPLREEANAKRRERWANDPAYRERNLAPRRGRDQRNDQLKAHYGITLEIYIELLAKQGGCCAICRQLATETLCVDHCHDSLIVRGLLCRKCNTGLGCYGDDASMMHRAIAYLERHRVD